MSKIKGKKKKRIDFSEIFYYAEKHFNISWNAANDMFFNNSLDYKSFNEFFGGASEFYEENAKFEDLDLCEKGYYIINDYMEKNNIYELFVDNK